MKVSVNNKKVINKKKKVAKPNKAINSTSKNIKKGQQPNKSKKKVLIFFTVFIVIALLGFGIYFLCTSSKFNITKIQVEGNSKYSVEEILKNSDIKTGKNIFTMSGNKTKENLKALPYIENINVIKKYPDTVVIKVEERKSEFFAYAKDKNLYYRLNSRGVILEQTPVEQKTTEEILTYGITFDNEVTLGNLINESDISKLVIFNKISDEFKRINLNMAATKVSFENSLTIISLNDKLNVIFPNDTNLKYNVSFLKNIIANISDAQGIIDLTKSNPTFSAM